jgi:hypothetical protein
MAYQERWTSTKGANGEYSFSVKQGGLTLGQIVMCVLSTPLFGLGIAILIFLMIAKSKAYSFAVGAEGFRVGGKLIPMNRVNAYGVTNPHDGVIHDLSSMGGAVQASNATKAYRVTVQAGGGKVDLAKGLTLEQARGLVADIERALNGTL